MKKRLIASLTAVILCLAMLFSGCSVVRIAQKNLQVALEVNGEYYGSYTVDIFNNAVVPEPVMAGMKFKGWSPKEDWTEGVDGEELILPTTSLIRYNDVKDFVVNNENSVTLYGIFVPIPKRDLVVAWYNRPDKSGLTEEIMAQFKTNLFAYLSEQGYKPEEMDIVIRGYEGDVGTTCSEITKDGDVDIMVGWAASSNLISTGGYVEGVDFVENVGNITIGTGSRYAARKTDTELCKLVYIWIQNEYGAGAVVPEPEPEPDNPSASITLTIAWYNNSVSGLSSELMDELKTNLLTYLTEQGYAWEDLNVIIRAYDGNVGTSCGNIKADGDVDIMVGWAASSNLAEKADWVEGTDFIMNYGNVKIGDVARYAAWLTDNEVSELAYYWIITEYGDYVPPVDEPEPDPEPEPSTKLRLVIAWYNKPETSGLTEAIIANFEASLKNYLVEQGYNLDNIDLELRGYTGNVKTSCASIMADGDVDIMIGWAANISSTNSTGGQMVEGQDYIENVANISMGGLTRNIARITDTDIVNLVFDWIESGGAADSLAEIAAEGD